MRPAYRLLPWLVLALIVAGCGGMGGTADEGRGEGNIPVGKVVDPEPAPARIIVHTSTRRRIEAYTDPSGYVFLPQLPPGPTFLVVTPLDPAKQETSLGYVAGAHQSDVFHINLIDVGVNVSPNDFAGSFRDHTVIVVGEKRDLDFRLSLPTYGIVFPSYWVSGGVASIRDGVLIGREPGQGELTVAVGEARRKFRFTVIPAGK